MMSSSGEVEAQPTTVEKIPAPEVEVPVAAGEEKDKEMKKKKKKPTKEKQPNEKKPRAPAHPPYFQMIKEAITALNEKGGSSPYAIAKYMEENHKAVLPGNFRKALGLQLKNSVGKGKLIKVKASYKLSEAGKREKSRATTTKAARANAVKPNNNNNNKRKKRPKSKAVSKIENMTTIATTPAPLVATTRGRRTKKAAPTKPKQLKSIKSAIPKKPKMAAA